MLPLPSEGDVSEVLHHGVEDDDEEGEEEAEEHPHVDHLHVGGPGQRGGGGDEEGRDDQHPGQPDHDPDVVVLDLVVVGQVDDDEQAGGGQVGVEQLVAHPALQGHRHLAAGQGLVATFRGGGRQGRSGTSTYPTNIGCHTSGYATGGN